MIATQTRPLEQILAHMEGENAIFILGCAGCPEGCETGGEEQLARLTQELEGAGKTVTGRASVDFLCNKSLVALRLMRHLQQVAQADALLVVSCGVGVQATAAVIDKMVHPALNSVYLGGFQGLWRGSERCAECGECLLDYTGGICPITACTKGLLHGACGGSDKGRCEIDPNIECGWTKIYERLKALGRLDVLRRLAPERDYQKMTPSAELRQRRLYALEREAEAKPAPAAAKAA